ncbi:hypothetical protein Q4I32_002298 [Leishmania shawi]|uniref:Uncharacterized protein n=1 Tax=Leishmania shawi TaxID=5680 RepID=A0AAW3C4B1_9TRYP
MRISVAPEAVARRHERPSTLCQGSMTQNASHRVLSECGGLSLLRPAVHATFRLPRQHSRQALSLLAAFAVLACLCSPRVSAISDAFEKVPNAFSSTGTAVRAVYEAMQLTSDNFTLGSWEPLRSSAYVLCDANGDSFSDAAARSASPAVDFIAQAWCTSYGMGILVNQSVHWSTMAPPGLQLGNSSMLSSRALLWDCLTYSCDMENLIVAHSAGQAPSPAVGGLGVSTPCCGSTNSTFVLYMTRGLLVQSAALPVAALNREAEALYSSVIDEENTRNSLNECRDTGSSRSGAGNRALRSSKSCLTAAAASRASLAEAATTPSRSKEMDFCLVRQLPPSLFAGTARSDHGDGGVVFSVNASICGADITDRINEQDATLIMRGYTAVLTTAEGVEELSFPKELIVSMASWIASPQNNSSSCYDGEQSLLRKKGCCTWGLNASQTTAYRTGEYLECPFDPSALAHLPPLVLSVRDESIVSTDETSNACRIALHLSSCMTPDGKALRFYSTGSLVSMLERHKHTMGDYREPPIVVGMQQLRGATVAVTRRARISKWSSGASDAGYNLPLLYLAVPRGTAVAADVNTLGALCVTSAACGTHQTFYPSLNRCAYVPCTRVFLYSFDADTFTCTPRRTFVGIFATLCFTLLATEGLVLYLRRKTEWAKEVHMRLVRQVQRRDTEAE